MLSVPSGFAVRSSTPLPTLQGRRLLLSQVLSNLVGNAVKHHDKTMGNIDISSVERAEHYEFAIADDGPGIPAAYRGKVFEIFQTLAHDDSTTNTGIGLALVKKIVEGEGGQLWLDEAAKTGCKFCFTWPKMVA